MNGQRRGFQHKDSQNCATLDPCLVCIKVVSGSNYAFCYMAVDKGNLRCVRNAHLTKTHHQGRSIHLMHQRSLHYFHHWMDIFHGEREGGVAF